nr:MAG TPA: hypothetical protein [Caudoviricetes sp.]
MDCGGLRVRGPLFLRKGGATRLNYIKEVFLLYFF